MARYVCENCDNWLPAWVIEQRPRGSEGMVVVAPAQAFCDCGGYEMRRDPPLEFGRGRADSTPAAP